MIEFLTSKGFLTVAGTLATIIGGVYVPGVRTLFAAAFRSFLSYNVLKRLIIELLRGFVKSTKTTVDDVWLEEFEKDLQKREK